MILYNMIYIIYDINDNNQMTLHIPFAAQSTLGKSLDKVSDVLQTLMASPAWWELHAFIMDINTKTNNK